MKKWSLFLLGISSLAAFEPPNHITFEAIETNAAPVTLGLNDLTILKDKIARTARKQITATSLRTLESPKMLRTQSEGHLTKIDCKTLDLQIHYACTRAAEVLKPIEASHSVLAKSTNFETYQEAQKYYRNALSTLIISFNLNCYDAFEKINQILDPFIEIEYKKKEIYHDYQFDQKIYDLYWSLDKVLHVEKTRRKQLDSGRRICTHISKDITEIRLEKAQQAFDKGRAYYDGIRETRKSIINPSLEHYEFIELLAYNAFEDFITAYNCDCDAALEQAHAVLQELEAIHGLKLQQYNTIGTRYPEALEKFKSISKNATELRLFDEATDHSAPEKKITDSNQAVKKEESQPTISEQSEKQKTTPLSLLKTMWRYTKKGTKTIWKKLPF